MLAVPEPASALPVASVAAMVPDLAVRLSVRLPACVAAHGSAMLSPAIASALPTVAVCAPGTVQTGFGCAGDCETTGGITTGGVTTGGVTTGGVTTGGIATGAGTISTMTG